MENASKALIIAGAILLSILIIALGIYVFNMAKSATNTNSLDELEVSTFNSPFLNYEGKIIGNNVKSLLDKVIASAREHKDADEKLPDITYYDESSKGPVFNVAGTNGFGRGTMGNIISNVENTHLQQINELRSGISNSHYYQVNFDYDTETSLINLITIRY